MPTNRKKIDHVELSTETGVRWKASFVDSAGKKVSEFNTLSSADAAALVTIARESSIFGWEDEVPLDSQNSPDRLVAHIDISKIPKE